MCAKEDGPKLIEGRRAGFATLMASCTCPVFRPSLEEFRDFQAYLENIEPHVCAYGICKIIPPEGWWQTPIEVEQICRVDGTMYASVSLLQAERFCLSSSGDFGECEIAHPIEQTLVGKKGVFEVCSVALAIAIA